MHSYKLYSSLPDLATHKIWAEIDLDALRSNYRALAKEVKKGTPDCRPMCVVKADAYGHGIDACVDALLGEGCDFFAVSSIEEALAVRQVCRSVNADADILILGYTPAEEAVTLSRCNIIQTVFSSDYARALSMRVSAAGKALRVHIKFDTGMNRIGFPAHSADEIERSAHEIAAVSALPGIIVEGAFTHFARADETAGDARTREQAERYFALLERSRALGAPISVRHICNSAATLRFPEYHLDLCRLGVLLYGAEPSDMFDFEVKPVMRLCAQISQVHTACRRTAKLRRNVYGSRGYAHSHRSDRVCRRLHPRILRRRGGNIFKGRCTARHRQDHRQDLHGSVHARPLRHRRARGRRRRADRRTGTARRACRACTHDKL